LPRYLHEYTPQTLTIIPENITQIPGDLSLLDLLHQLFTAIPPNMKTLILAGIQFCVFREKKINAAHKKIFFLYIYTLSFLKTDFLCH